MLVQACTVAASHGKHPRAPRLVLETLP
jgi:hypothetical protein